MPEITFLARASVRVSVKATYTHRNDGAGRSWTDVKIEQVERDPRNSPEEVAQLKKRALEIIAQQDPAPAGRAKAALFPEDW